MEKKQWIKARVIDKTHPKYGKVVEVNKVADTRFFANRWEIKQCQKLVFGDQLDFKDVNENKPVPVMFSLYGSPNGPWHLGYIHPDDLPKIDKIHIQADQTNKKLQTPVFDVFDGIPCYPAKIVLFEDFKPDWNPSWNWDVYATNRK